jgi:S-phase kinase-associated protein 1
MTKQVTLETFDKHIIHLDENIAKRSEVLKQMLEDIPDSDEPIPIFDKSCELTTMNIIVAYLSKHQHFDDNKVVKEERDKFDKDFIKVEDDVLFNIILAANYLDIKSLLDLTCKTVADYIKQCKTTEEIRQRFNIVNDFTPEEEDEVRKENAWCDEI